MRQGTRRGRGLDEDARVHRRAQLFIKFGSQETRKRTKRKARGSMSFEWSREGWFELKQRRVASDDGQSRPEISLQFGASLIERP